MKKINRAYAARPANWNGEFVGVTPTLTGFTENIIISGSAVFARGETRYEPLYATPSEALARCFEDGCYSPELIFVISGKFEFVPYGLGRFATLPGTKTRVLKTMPVEIVAEKTVRASINPSCKVPGLTGVNVLYKNWLTTVESRNAPAVWAWGGNTSIAIRDALGVEPFSCSNLEEENAWLQCSK